MKQSGLQFTELQLLRIVERLEKKGEMEVGNGCSPMVFVYTKLLSILEKAQRPQEALRIFNLMLGDCLIYPDSAAYHSIAVTLGQAGLLKQLLNIIECMRYKPSKRIKNMRRKNWDPVLEPDLVVCNVVCDHSFVCHSF
ncbi:hypothetical protein PTKIN_Ptkin15bG0054900 [Pterospermum kingtungense]